LAAVLTLADSGVKLIEVSFTSTDALGVLRRARAALGDAARGGDLSALRRRAADFLAAVAA
jgi:2-dehydro-3-deoxyphosphogluconate aldolase / (4S)-4-hydroxy-2-oxoglutarate aldolase